MCWYILAINHEDEISIYSRGGEKHNHEFLPYTTQPFCLRGTIQCKQQQQKTREKFLFPDSCFSLKKVTNNEGTQGIHKPVQLKHVDK